MMILTEEWMESKYITVDSDGWHCSEDAPEENKQKFKEFMEEVNKGPVLEE